ncbi:hypothetical protein FXO38_30500 [Capsicum annuum]|nr:hypothetical protein FXO38_30500 [Capsicum annuum]
MARMEGKLKGMESSLSKRLVTVIEYPSLPNRSFMRRDQPNQVEAIKKEKAKNKEKNLAQEREFCEIVEPQVKLNEGDKEYLIVELFKPKPLLHTNHGTSIFPSTNSFFTQVHKLMLPKKDLKKTSHEHNFEGPYEFLFKDSKVDENLT